MRKIFHYLSVLLFAFTIFLISHHTSYASVPYEASDVLGQTDSEGNVSFTSNDVNNGSGNEFDATGLNQVMTTLIDATHHRLFVFDSYNYRILIYTLDENNNLIDHVADYVLGQVDLNEKDYVSATASSIGDYGGLAIDIQRNRLFVAEYTFSRVLVFDLSSGISNNMEASYVLGQADFVSSDNTLVTQNRMSEPAGLAFDPETDLLYVSEYGHSRITIFDVSPNVIENGMNASYVIGQPDFTTYNTACNDHSFDYQWPIALDIEHKRLFVGDGDSGNNARVMIFDVSTITNGESAVHILGQSDFDSCNAPNSPTRSNVYYPYNAIIYDSRNETLFVDHADGFKRMTVYDVSQINDGEDAIAVIGQSDFVSNTQFTPTLSSISGNYQGNMALDSSNQRLYYGDTQNNRILIFNFVRLPSSLATPTLGRSYTYSSAATQSQGTVTYSVTSGALPDGLSLNTQTGEITGTPTKWGTYTFTLKAIDDNGAIGYFFDTQTYTLTVGNEPPRPEGEYSTTDVPLCNTPKPSTIPTLFQIDRSYDTATIHFTPTTENTSHYLISYGEDNNAEGYSVTLDQPSDTSGAISYPIHSLNPNKSYYFKVRNGNSCNPGNWSEVRKDTNLIVQSAASPTGEQQLDTTDTNSFKQDTKPTSQNMYEQKNGQQTQESSNNKPNTQSQPWYQSLWRWITGLFH